MGFIAWHYLVRVGFPVFMALVVAGFLLPQSGVANAVGGAGGIGVFILGASGAILAVRLLIRGFKFACPQCKGRETDFGMSRKKAMWLYCPKCGVFEESGFLKTQISHNAEGVLDGDEADEEEDGEEEAGKVDSK
jgi:predicted RNA-binding Zn-ribbon protein involved in translation (DUF1610 family)